VLIVNSATEKPFTMKSKTYCQTVAWISHNQLACGYHDGTVEIHEIGSHNRQLNSRMVHKIKHFQGENARSMYFYDRPALHSISKEASYHVTFVMGIIWNEELNLLASGGTDERVKVLKQNVVYLMI
jgi:transducin (beta)-like 1